jgi:hypothetical protein
MTFPDKIYLKDKRLLALEREYNRLLQAKAEAPVVPLERPYQRGWVKSFVLAPDVLRRPDLAVFRTMLAAINQRLWCKNREFINRLGEPLLLRPRIIGLREWARLRWPASHLRLFTFGHWEDGDTLHYRPWFRRRRLITGYTIRRPWWLKEAVWPHLITHQRVAMPEVETRLAEIESEFQRRQGRCRLSWLHGHRVRWRERHSLADRIDHMLEPSAYDA